jgi:glutamine synthetase
MNILILEYIWIDNIYNLRSKTKVLTINNIPENIDEKLKILPEWNYDGSSTGQAKGYDSEIIIKPCAIYKDPFRSGNSYFVLCDTYCKDNNTKKIIPHKTNNRVKALEIFNKYKYEEPMYGIEQEFFLADKNNVPLFRNLILQNYINNDWDPQGNYYCGIGSRNIIGRKFMEQALTNCINAGLNITGMNAEVAPGQWEFQVFATGINASDQLYIMRYILNRTAELFDWSINLHPKPIQGDWNGSGCHVNFSTKNMRENGGIEYIESAIQKLSKAHNKHMENYGLSNHLRMTGEHETADYYTFSYGVSNRGASIRIPNSTYIEKKGYFEDRRPASNMDPYIVTSMILETSIQ